MKISDFDFELPSNLIAQKPISPRDNSKLLLINKNKFIDKNFFDLPDLLKKNDLIICNNTKVLASKLFGKRNTSSIQITLHKKNSDKSWLAFSKPAKKINVGDVIEFDNFKAKILEKLDYGEIRIMFDCDNEELIERISKVGRMPLPPYIKRSKEEKNLDKINYQTIFANKIGAVAAPTAGLHFTESIINKIKSAQIDLDYITLHVGAGTFLPIKEEIETHKMHAEWGEVSNRVVEKIKKCKESGGRVISIGTTTLRILETAFDKKENSLKPFSGNTDIFIKPGYKFNVIDMLLTNFHLPKSTLMMLVSAFGGYKNIKLAYQYAIKNNYRFFSYGDCCLIKALNE